MTLALFPDVGNKRHKAGAFDGFGHGMLADGGAAAFSPADDFSLPIGQLFQQFHVFVIHVHRPWALAIDKDRIFLFAADLGLGVPLTDFINLQFSCHSFTRLKCLYY